jgi:hypothetical protein
MPRSPTMPSLSQRLEAAARDFVSGVLEVIRETPIDELRALHAPSAATPRLVREGAHERPVAKRSHTKSRSSPGAASSEAPRKIEKPGRPTVRGLRDRPQDPEQVASQGAFDVTSPELLLLARPVAEAKGLATAPSPAPSAPPPETEANRDGAAAAPPSPSNERPHAEPTLRPGETVARANGAGIVIKREKRA